MVEWQRARLAFRWSRVRIHVKAWICSRCLGRPGVHPALSGYPTSVGVVKAAGHCASHTIPSYAVAIETCERCFTCPIGHSWSERELTTTNIASKANYMHCICAYLFKIEINICRLYRTCSRNGNHF